MSRWCQDGSCPRLSWFMSATFTETLISWFVTIYVCDFHDLCPQLYPRGSFVESWHNRIWAVLILVVCVICRDTERSVHFWSAVGTVQTENFWPGFTNSSFHHTCLLCYAAISLLLCIATVLFDRAFIDLSTWHWLTAVQSLLFTKILWSVLAVFFCYSSLVIYLVFIVIHLLIWYFWFSLLMYCDDWKCVNGKCRTGKHENGIFMGSETCHNRCGSLMCWKRCVAHNLQSSEQIW